MFRESVDPNEKDSFKVQAREGQTKRNREYFVQG
jgi:hypothetical protein